MFLDEYIPQTVRDDKREDFMKLEQQWGQSVTEYTELFKKLCKYADPVYRTAAGMRDRYVRGLRAELRKCMGEAERASQATTYRASLRIERDEKMAEQERDARLGTKKRKEPTNSGATTYSPQPSKWGPGSSSQHQSWSQEISTRYAPTQQLYPLCPKCDKRHLGQCRRNMGVCFECGEPGHIKWNCPRLADHTRVISEPSVNGGRAQTGSRFSGRTNHFDNNSNNNGGRFNGINTHNARRDESQMSKAGGRPRVFAMEKLAGGCGEDGRDEPTH
ncbi:unnamed protein product [Linum trigynum]|uniref:CCHC-type domain-containing protein n=1 Tax=Linum trigynum TaxID=586398 RepID=A0AAV2GNH0_9ROSI